MISKLSFPSFPVCISLISFSFLFALVKTSSTLLNRCGESGQPCLVPNISGIALSFSPFKLVLAMGLLNCLYYVEFMKGVNVKVLFCA